jgi:hypothetical protein
MPVQEIVHILTDLIDDGESRMAQRHGPQAVSAAQGARSLVADRLSEDMSDDALWSDFESDPRGTAAELTGTLEALVEADPALAERLEGFLQEYYRAARPIPTGANDAPQEDTELDEPDAPETELLEQYDEDVGQGTYLYGNLEPGAVSVEERIDAAETEEALPRQIAGVSLETAGTAPPFPDLYAAIESYPGLDPGEQRALKNALRGVLNQVARNIMANEERLLYHLMMLKRLNADLFEIIHDELRDQEDLPEPVDRALTKARETEI